MNESRPQFAVVVFLIAAVLVFVGFRIGFIDWLAGGILAGIKWAAATTQHVAEFIGRTVGGLLTKIVHRCIGHE